MSSRNESDSIGTIDLAADAVVGFTRNCLQGIEADAARLALYAGSSLMRAAELTPYIGYDKAAKCAQYAEVQGSV